MIEATSSILTSTSGISMCSCTCLQVGKLHLSLIYRISFITLSPCWCHCEELDDHADDGDDDLILGIL